jgi:uncharacterized protein YecT (DUF1311 family)
MFIRSIVFTILSYSIITPVFANSSAIDKETDACMDKNPSTLGMQECHENAYKSWDNELNKVYKKLAGSQNKGVKAQLKISELNWITFRDSEIKFIEKMYQSQEGTYWGTVAGEMKINIVKNRVLVLQSYVDSLSPENP